MKDNQVSLRDIMGMVAIVAGWFWLCQFGLAVAILTPVLLATPICALRIIDEEWFFQLAKAMWVVGILGVIGTMILFSQIAVS